MNTVLQPGIPVRVSRDTWNGIEAYNKSEAGRGVDTSATTFNGDGTVTMLLTPQLIGRLLQVDHNIEAAIRKAVGLKSN